MDHTKDNPYFAKSYVNRLWSYLLGVGIIEPVDDIRAGNPPTNPQLLDKLTEEFIKSDFNVQQLIKTIAKSRTYQHSIKTNQWNKDDDVNYSHATAKRLSAEVLFDSIHRVTGSISKIPGLPPGSRAVQIVDSKVKIPGSFLDILGKPPRESACECERTNAMQLGPVLAFLTGPVLNDAINDPKNRIAKIAAEQKDDAKVVEELYLAILNRRPSETELARDIKALQGNDELFTKLSDERKRRTDAVAAYEKQIPNAVAQFEQTRRHTPLTTLEGDEIDRQGDIHETERHSILVTGLNPQPESYTITFETKMDNITGIRLEALPDKSLPAQGPGRRKRQLCLE